MLLKPKPNIKCILFVWSKVSCHRRSSSVPDVQGDQDRFRQLRNLVNRKRKVLRNSYYTTKVANLKFAKPSQWWSEVKKIAGMAPATPTGDICSVLQINGINGNSEKFIADVINSALLEPMH